MLYEVTAPAGSAEPATWLRQRMVDFAASVTSIVPSGFERYGRLFHPPMRRPSESVRWSEVAAARGRIAHGAMQWTAINGTNDRRRTEPQPGLWDFPPTSGSLPIELIEPLIDVLARHSATPDRCWFAVWEGFGALPDEARRGPTFDLPHRRYHLFGGPIAASLESAEPPPWQQSANLWWPDDHAWCVATEIDLDTTYLAVSQPCLDELLAVNQLEILEAQPTDGISVDSDKLNPGRPKS